MHMERQEGKEHSIVFGVAIARTSKFAAMTDAFVPYLPAADPLTPVSMSTARA